ncbi:Imm1 family immunity protein [Amycolatopsis sp. NPDC059021]|uniref:Imm1 family immunity protein n=1 Tax=Amycolatopsis sp. NPDC059021 TaxID=3346704 RepID=UPI00366F12FE
MVELDIWYDRTPKNDQGDVVIHVSTAGQLDELIDRIIHETADNAAPPMIQVAVSGTKRQGMEVGLGKDKGFIKYIGRTEGGQTRGDATPDLVVDYVYMGSHTQVPAEVEVPIDLVRRGLHEFLATGERPSVVSAEG